MYYSMRCTFDCLEGLTDDMLSCLCQHLNGHIVRYHIAVDQRPHKIIFGLGRCRESDFDLFETDLY